MKNQRPHSIQIESSKLLSLDDLVRSRFHEGDTESTALEWGLCYLVRLSEGSSKERADWFAVNSLKILSTPPDSSHSSTLSVKLETISSL